MPHLPLVYIGKPGIEADVFRTYMVSSGFTVQIVTDTQGQLPESLFDEDAITVISLRNSSEELARFEDEIRSHNGRAANRILILADRQSLGAKATALQVIFRPYRLSEIAARIRAISRGD